MIDTIDSSRKSQTTLEDDGTCRRDIYSTEKPVFVNMLLTNLLVNWLEILFLPMEENTQDLQAKLLVSKNSEL